MPLRGMNNLMPLPGMSGLPKDIPTRYGPVDLNAHNDFNFLEGDGLSSIRFFVTPVVAILNYLDASYAFARYDMVGLSGGAWTTVIAAALDPRITGSYHVAGSLPIPLQNKVGDFENQLPQLYEIAGYTELYVLGAAGPGREQLQILNRFEPGGLSPTAPLLYEEPVNGAIASIGEGGRFEALLDTTTVEHVISDFAIKRIKEMLR